MMRALIRGSAAIAAIAWSMPALATNSQCVDFELIGNGARTDYQPFESSPTTEAFDVRIDRRNDNVRSVRFLLVDQTPQASGPQLGTSGPLNYDIIWLEDSTRRVFVVGNEQPQPMTGAEVTLPGRSGVQVTRFRLTVPPGQQAPAQTHRENLLIRYQCLDGNGRVIGTTQEKWAGIELKLTVPRYAAAYIGSIGNTRGTISFGDVGAPGATLAKAINVTALSTTPYVIDFNSENKGLLKRRRNDEEGIRYTMTYGGAAVADGDKLLCPTTPAPMGRGELFEVTLDRDSITPLRAGHYEDTVTLTFTPRDVVNVSSCTVRR